MRFAYFSAGPRTMASSRLRVHKIADALRAQGHDVTVNGYPWSSDVVVVQKRTDLTSIMQQCRDRDIRVIYDVDDYIPNLPVECADAITVDTPAKLELYPTAIVVPDALDVDADTPRKSVHADELRTIVWSGSAENAYHLRYVAEACKTLALNLVVITDIGSPSYAHFDGVSALAWDVDTVDAEMIKADVAVCPFVFNGAWSKEWVASKSANKLLKAWALGLPVIGTGIPSYLEAGLRYCATSADEWVKALLRLASASDRAADAERGRAIADCYRAEEVTKLWLEVFERR